MNHAAISVSILRIAGSVDVLVLVPTLDGGKIWVNGPVECVEKYLEARSRSRQAAHEVHWRDGPAITKRQRQLLTGFDDFPGDVWDVPTAHEVHWRDGPAIATRQRQSLTGFDDFPGDVPNVPPAACILEYFSGSCVQFGTSASRGSEGLFSCEHH